MTRFSPSPDEVGERIDVVLARRSGVARSTARDAVRGGGVTVGGRRVRPSYRLGERDEVEGEVAAGAHPLPQAEELPLAVRYEDERVLVVSKPAGVVVHPGPGHAAGTLVNALLGSGRRLAATGSLRPGIVHRLDKDTSGLLLVAKDDEAHAALAAALKSRRIERRYLALVRGALPAESGTVDAPVGRHPRRRTLMAVVPGGRPAVTHYAVLATAPDLSLVEARLETGRTHQIRVHLAHLGHPVLGDPLYSGKGELSARLGLARPFLHARLLRFPRPGDGRTVEVVDPLPDDLAGALGRTGLDASRLGRREV